MYCRDAFRNKNCNLPSKLTSLKYISLTLNLVATRFVKNVWQLKTKQNTKSISLVISSQQISGKNSVSKKNCHEMVLKKSVVRSQF